MSTFFLDIFVAFLLIRALNNGETPAPTAALLVSVTIAVSYLFWDAMMPSTWLGLLAVPLLAGFLFWLACDAPLKHAIFGGVAFFLYKVAWALTLYVVSLFYFAG